MATNISDVRLLYVPFDNEYKHTLYFSNRSVQELYFKNVPPSLILSSYSYQRKDSKLRLNLSFDEALKYNYVMYKNTEYNNKYFYAFITDYEWRNEDVTEVTLETDVMQTWLPIDKDHPDNDYEIKPSFVEREHTKDDTIGANTIPENLESGEYIINWQDEMKPFTALKIVVGITADSSGKGVKGTRYNGCYSGIAYRAFPLSTDGISALNAFLTLYDTSSDIDNNAIVSMFLAPADLTPTGDLEISVSVVGSESPYNKLFEFDRFIEYKGYEPKNNKLYCYPYNYLLVSNNNGGSAIYQFEHFKNTKMAFAVYGVLTPGCSIRMIPMNYKGSLLNDEEGLNLGKYPICNWTSDEYTNWLTQNSVNIGLNLVSGIAQVVGGGAVALATAGTGAVLGGGAVLSGVGSIANQLAQIHQMSFTPPQANGNINSGDVITAINKNTFSLYQMCCKPEYMKVIDEYLSTYGYKTNRIKIPEKDHRENWWFTKTIDINIVGRIPVDDLNKIKSCYNNGITFWRNASNIKNYSVSNAIV